MEQLIQKANVLLESLPYIKNFYSKTFVVKYGGSTMDDSLKRDIIQDLIMLKYIGINIIVVHGGGNEITNYLNKLNIQNEFVNGRRVTGASAMEVVQMVLVGKINQEIVSMINQYGGKAVGLSGNDANLLVAKKKLPEIVFDEKTNSEKTVDLGFVGEIEKVNEKLIAGLSERGFIPVISPIGAGIDGESYNLNADDVASSVAQALKADKLIILTDVDGIYEVKDNPNTKITMLTVEKANQMIANNQIVGGMIPKVNACINAINNGTKRTHIIDGRERHSILLEIFTDKGIGTMVTD